MSTDIYTTHKKLNELLGIDGIVPELTNKWFKDIHQPQDPEWQYRKGEMNPMYGAKHTDETKRLMSINSKGKTAGAKNGMYGVKHTKEVIRFLSEHAKTRTGAKNSMYGKTHTDETREKQRQCKLGRKLTIIDGKRRYV